ncbi:hypothetical protein GCK32_002030 [Trichostrongylus colubriformis]|uniref:Uncharacterized protein n=1 Tax=Trichostrongylus colubriformis TaxID=6319 RepID=A0AAN8FA97_TRICO
MTKQTVPRLETLNILLATRLANTIIEAMNTNITQFTIASGSEIALSQVKSTRKLPIFVDNQVARLRKITTQLKLKGPQWLATDSMPAKIREVEKVEQIDLTEDDVEKAMAELHYVDTLTSPQANLLSHFLSSESLLMITA